MRRYVVGYTATENGRGAVNLAVALARSQQASLDLVVVHSPDSPYAGTYPPSDRGYERILAEQLDQWLAEGLALVPHDVTAKAHILQAESTAEGLIEAAREFSAAVIVVGAARRRRARGVGAQGLPAAAAGVHHAPDLRDRHQARRRRRSAGSVRGGVLAVPAVAAGVPGGLGPG
ncbi:universal stress protein [Arthrobacter crystallopoietes]|uniref:universal stress protein n=1 Tax=Crystallibacter crystallopoietes TaxID=37928 RepID=UPI00329A2896